jgi:Domain of unknown function (DUF4942)
LEDDKQELARRYTIPELVAAWREAEAAVRLSFRTLVEAQRRLNAVFMLDGGHPIRVSASRYHPAESDFEDADGAIERMARDAWATIVAKCELRRMMSIQRARELDEQLRQGELPPITEENVASFVQGCLDNLPKMLEEAVGEVFDWLRPCHTDYKTNNKIELGSKVVLTYMVDKAWCSDGFRVNTNKQQHLTAMENVFHALDGKGQISKSYKSELEMAIEVAGAEGRGETPLFKFRAFKNRNLHLEFKRLDLLKKFNMIAGGRNLRPAEGEVA